MPFIFFIYFFPTLVVRGMMWGKDSESEAAQHNFEGFRNASWGFIES